MPISTVEVAPFLVQEHSLTYNTIAASAFIFWDYIITFEQEVDLVWNYGFSLVNFLFFLIRYLTFAVRITHILFYANASQLIRPSLATCRKWVWFEAIAGQILFAAVEILLIIRVHAFYGRNRYFLAGIMVAFLTSLGAEFGILFYFLPKTTIMPTPFPVELDPSACLISAIPETFHNFWIPGLTFETILFVLVIARFIRMKLTRTGTSPHFLIVFVRDGAWAFVLLFALLLWAALTFGTENGYIALTWIYSMIAFCGTRLTLNLRMASREHKGLDDNFPLSSLNIVVEFKVSTNLAEAAPTSVQNVPRIDTP